MKSLKQHQLSTAQHILTLIHRIKLQLGLLYIGALMLWGFTLLSHLPRIAQLECLLSYSCFAAGWVVWQIFRLKKSWRGDEQ